VVNKWNRGLCAVLSGGALVCVIGATAAALANGCWELTDQGWGCDNAGATLSPCECILSTTTNTHQDGFQAATGPGKTGSEGSFDVVCEQKIGVLNGAGVCVEPQGQTITHQGLGNDQWLMGSNCNAQPGGGSG